MRLIGDSSECNFLDNRCEWQGYLPTAFSTKPKVEDGKSVTRTAQPKPTS
jgi:hypothetical protein